MYKHFRVYIYIYTRKCHKETPCVAMLTNENVIFFPFYKIKEQEGRIGPAWGGDWH
jgi:hypothetical protein